MSTRLLVILAVMLVALGFAGRYYNDEHAEKLAAAVVQADKVGADTTAPTTALQAYAKGHMGVSVTYTRNRGYERAQQQAKAQAAAQAANAQVYADAQRACGGRRDSVALAKCNQDYLAKHLVPLPNPTPVTAPELADFQHTVKGPLWTPDVAGVLFLGALLMLVWAGLSHLRRRR